MSSKIDPKLSQRLQQTQTTEPHREIPVIVTLNQGADVLELERRSFKIQHRFKSISAVSGTMTAAGVNQLAQLDSVAGIEYDEPAWALEEKQP